MLVWMSVAGKFGLLRSDSTLSSQDLDAMMAVRADGCLRQRHKTRRTLPAGL